jgi:hypothetical protein
VKAHLTTRYAKFVVHDQLTAARTPAAQTALQRQTCPDAGRIDFTDRQACPDAAGIDQLVYEVYGLTDDEIRIVEEATR